MEPTLAQQLIAAFHLEHLPAEEAQEVLDDAGTVIMNQVLTRGIPLLDEEGARRCDTLLEQEADISEIFALIQEKVPHVQDIIDEEIAFLKKTLQ